MEERDPWAALVAATHATIDDCIADALSQTAGTEALALLAHPARHAPRAGVGRTGNR